MKKIITLSLWLFIVSQLLTSCGVNYDRPTTQQFSQFLAEKNHRSQFEKLQRYLKRHHVDNIVEADQLLRQGTDWRENGISPFAIPPRSTWPQIVPTLTLLKNHIIPEIGPVEVLSGFRTPEYNAVAGGAKKSKHLIFSAVDILPKQAISREKLHQILLAIWGKHGKKSRMGLGLYQGIRFHIDTKKFRRW